MANQEFKGIKKAVQQRIEGLKNFKQEPGLFISEQLISELAYITSETQREVCVYITRSGEIIFSSIGERDRVSLENMSMRRSEQRLSGFRCIHTHPGGSDMLSEVDIQSLKSLRLDAMAAIGVKDGRAGYISAAVLESIEGELRPKFMRSPSWNLPHEQWMQAIMEADRAIVKSRVYQTAPQKERVMLLGHGDLAELEALTLTAGGEICARVVQKNKPLGEGKLKQAALEAQALPEKAPAPATSRATAANRAPELLFLALALLVSAASVACGLLFTNYAFAGLIATAGLSVLYMRAKDTREAAEEAPAAAAPEGGRELAAARRERAMYVQQSERLAGQIAQMEAAIEAEMAPPDPARQEALISARVELEALEKRAGDPAALRARLAALKSRESALLQRLAALDMAEEALGEAARERQQGFAPELAGHVERILSRVTSGKYARAAISQSLEISLQPGAGALQPWEFFSGGTVELMYLALRLGLIRMLEKHSGPLPALLDDPFVLLDDARCREALGVLRDAAQAGSQVLLFTCQDRTVLPGANVLELDP